MLYPTMKVLDTEIKELYGSYHIQRISKFYQVTSLSKGVTQRCDSLQ